MTTFMSPEELNKFILNIQNTIKEAYQCLLIVRRHKNFGNKWHEDLTSVQTDVNHDSLITLDISMIETYDLYSCFFFLSLLMCVIVKVFFLLIIRFNFFILSCELVLNGKSLNIHLLCKRND